MRIPSCPLIAAFCFLLTCGFAGLLACSAEKSDNRVRVVSAMFADGHIHESVPMISERAAAMTDPDRYSFLSRWVLPNDLHESLGVQIDFTRTQPAPPAEHEASVTPRRISSGGRGISPVLDRNNRLAMMSSILVRAKRSGDALIQIEELCNLSAQEQPDDQVHCAASGPVSRQYAFP